ncbi:winged helix-turn-helix domain-containing protein [Microbacterium sp. p3-SID131]|uniref:winged helix-turn-helix domain-containing protein n=1 Tax=Microbacterium sp. p3-SID131 TaxID=2916215 RepID=UPI0021A4819E|nr:winged helix-turn-helix domain-containing protein [Microbacterium sp. p3-SID131]MCT1363932.1 winged helix-turn-helix domain-containing protein [Microbacterium sp. p3-SID131]
MSVQGVPVAEATAKDFMMVRAALVKRLGGANEALVWTRIDWRTGSKDAHQVGDGRHWWAATYPELAEETGLSAEQVRRAVERLIEGGFILAEQHHGFSRTRSYTTVVISHLANLPDGQDASSIWRDDQMHLADSPNAPLYTDVTQEETSLSSDESADGILIPEGWRPNQSHIDKAASLHLDVKREYQRFRHHAETKHRRLKNWNAGFTNWLRKQAEFAQQNSGRTMTSTQGPNDRLRAGMEMGARLQEQFDLRQKELSA